MKKHEKSSFFNSSGGKKGTPSAPRAPPGKESIICADLEGNDPRIIWVKTGMMRNRRFVLKIWGEPQWCTYRLDNILALVCFNEIALKRFHNSQFFACLRKWFKWWHWISQEFLSPPIIETEVPPIHRSVLNRGFSAIWELEIRYLGKRLDAKWHW